jgi:hypothetical protein
MGDFTLGPCEVLPALPSERLVLSPYVSWRVPHTHKSPSWLETAGEGLLRASAGSDTLNPTIMISISLVICAPMSSPCFPFFVVRVGVLVRFAAAKTHPPRSPRGHRRVTA